MIDYQPKYESTLSKAGVERSQLEDSLRVLIDKFEFALNAARLEENSKRSDLLKVLAQADAIICSRLFSLYKVLPEQQKPAMKTVTVIDKTRAMALKAKALQLKWRNREGEKVNV